MKRFPSAHHAAIFYALLGVWPLGVMGVWLFTPPRSSLSDILSVPGATSLFLILVCLSVGSAMLVIALITSVSERAGAVWFLLALSFLLAALGLFWGLIAGVLYSLGFGSLLAAYRRAEAK